MAMTDPAGYAKYLQGPDWAQQARAAGLDPSTAARALLTKQSAIEVRPGQTVLDPISGRTMLGADPSKGEYYAIGPNGQVAAFPITNDATLQAWRAGLTTAAQQANTPHETPMGGGVSALRYPGQVPGLGNPPALGAAGAPPGAPAPGAMPGQLSPGAPPQGAASPPGAVTPPAAPRPAPIAASSVPGAPGSPAPITAARLWQSIPKLQIPNTPGITSDTYTTQNLQNAAAKKAELATQYGQNSSLADARIAFNNEALKALQGAETGPLSDTLTKLRAQALELGVPAQWIPGADTVADTQLLKKFALRNPLLNLKPTFGSRPAAAEFQILANDASPSPAMLKNVYARLAQLDNEQAQYTKQQAQDFGRYTQLGGDPQQFEQWYSNHRPLADYFAQQETPAAALARLRGNPQLLPDFKAKYGWDPTQWQ
jgi:hypothetical protein